MLDKPVDEIVCDGGKLIGVRSGNDVARCDMVICDPTYAPDRCKKVGQVILVTCHLLCCFCAELFAMSRCL